jgi:hypothetical protein
VRSNVYLVGSESNADADVRKSLVEAPQTLSKSVSAWGFNGWMVYVKCVCVVRGVFTDTKCMMHFDEHVMHVLTRFAACKYFLFVWSVFPWFSSPGRNRAAYCAYCPCCRLLTSNCCLVCIAVVLNLFCSRTPRYNFSSTLYPQSCWCIIQVIHSL